MQKKNYYRCIRWITWNANCIIWKMQQMHFPMRQSIRSSRNNKMKFMMKSWNMQRVRDDLTSFVLTIVIHLVWSWNLMHRIVYDLCVLRMHFKLLSVSLQPCWGHENAKRHHWRTEATSDVFNIHLIFQRMDRATHGTSVTNCNLTYLSQHLSNTTRDDTILSASHFVSFFYIFFFFDNLNPNPK